MRSVQGKERPFSGDHLGPFAPMCTCNLLSKIKSLQHFHKIPYADIYNNDGADEIFPEDRLSDNLT